VEPADEAHAGEGERRQHQHGHDLLPVIARLHVREADAEAAVRVAEHLDLPGVARDPGEIDGDHEHECRDGEPRSCGNRREDCHSHASNASGGAST
jgi:hypothetical protein